MYKNGFKLSDDLWGQLRVCQKHSVQVAFNYLKKSITIPMRSCLISLPTGAGKTGVIAIVCYKATQKKILVLSHRRAICDQLYSQISGEFICVNSNSLDKMNKRVFSDFSEIVRNGVYVVTFQMLKDLNSKQFGLIESTFDLIIVDEGHSEPAPVWRTLIRENQAHKIIFTATPYRNDLFQFDIDPDNSYLYTFKDAIKDDILSAPDFSTVESKHIIERIENFLKDYPSAKCIVKCREFADVERFYDLLAHNFCSLAVHDRYSNRIDTNHKVKVPKALGETDYQVIIHQRKLDEGVDIPQAKLLILTYSVGSGRELVQTVGRIVRKFEDIPPMVVSLDDTSNYKLWCSYQRFDSSLAREEGSQKFVNSLNMNGLLSSYLQEFPEQSYFDNTFMSKFDLNEFRPLDSLNIPTVSVCFLNKRSGFSLNGMTDTLYWQNTSNGELSKIFHPGLNFHVVVSVVFNKSNLLRDHLFFEPSLEVTVIKELSNNIVAVYDSRGRNFRYNSDLFLGSVLARDKILKILASDSYSEIREASGSSISTAKRRPESLMMRGMNLENIGSIQENASYSLSTIRSSIYETEERKCKTGDYYLGFGSGRLSDRKAKSLSLREFDDWLNFVSLYLDSDCEVTNSFICSYANRIDVNIDLMVESVILDFSNEPRPIEIDISGEKVVIDNSILHFDYDDGFLLDDRVPESNVCIILSVEAPYVEFRSEYEFFDINEEYESNIDLETIVNKCICKILFNNGVSYSDGEFYKFSLPVENELDFESSPLSRIIIGLRSLQGAVLDEKGYVSTPDKGKGTGEYVVTDGDEFKNTSIFYLLDQLKFNAFGDSSKSQLGPFNNYLPDVDLILNADMGTEPADFILSSPKKLVYVHVKCGTATIRPGSSAGSLAVVGTQAIKNIEYLISRNKDLVFGNNTELYTPWPNNSASKKMKDRLRLFNGNRVISKNNEERAAKLDQALDLLVERRRSTAVDKEIWVVAANSFSVSHFSTQLRLGNNAGSETLQAFQLIQSWISTAHANDVGLKIFVSP